MLMTIARRGGVCACLLLCSVLAVAQPPTAGRVLNLPEALARTLARNPELRFSISYTTRQKRRTEVDGVGYLLVDF